MRSLAWALSLVAVVSLAGCGFNAKTQAGRVNTNPSIRVQHGLLSGTVVEVDTVGRVSAAKLEYGPKEGLKAENLDIDSNPVPMVDARTKMISEAFLPLAEENTELNRVYGENTAIILEGIAKLATGILDGLPAGQLRQAVVGVVEAIAEAKVEAAKVAASQPAGKSDALSGPAE